jgi:hypothetical protein
MPVSDPESYLDQCIAALPPEKREAARRAFQEISETGDDSYLSKLLAVLEANNAYAKRIPKDLAETGAKLVRDVAGIADKLAQDEGRREAWIKRIVAEQFHQSGKSLALDTLASKIERQGQLLEQLNRPAFEPREERGAGVLVIIMAFAFLAGIGVTIWTFWDCYQGARQAQSFVDRAIDAGIRMRVDKTETGSRLTVVGPPIKSPASQHSTGGVMDGITIDFSEPR